MRVDGDVGVLEEVEFRAVAVPREQRVWLAMRRTVQEDITSDDHRLLTFETGSVDVRRLCNSQGHSELMDRAVYIKPVYVLVGIYPEHPVGMFFELFPLHWWRCMCSFSRRKALKKIEKYARG